MSRVRATVGVDVDGTPEQVFGYLADVARHGEWSPKAMRIEGVEPGTPATVGRRFVSYGWVPGDAEHRNEVEVVAVEAPRTLTLESTDRGETFVNTFTVTSRGRGVRVERTADFPRPGGLVRLVFPLIMSALVKPDMTKGLKLLKANVESVRR